LGQKEFEENKNVDSQRWGNLC